jgi:membrane protein implicated in regulation of membrane protease activity
VRVVFLILAFVVLLLLPSPWNFIGFFASLVLFLGELGFWSRSMRGRRKAVGAETLIGAEAAVSEACRPVGQVRVGGEIWQARCEAGADPGDTVRVVGLDGLTLVVERV